MIPKRIHYCWLSDDPFPALIARCVESWQRALPEYEFVRWDRRRFDIDRVPWVREAFAARKYAFAADYIRLHALREQGGIYLDADVEVVASFDPLLHERSFIGYDCGGDLEPAILGAEPGCQWINACLAHYAGRRFVRPDGSLDMTPLPVVVGAQLRRLGVLPAAAARTDPVARAGVTFYPADFFSPKDVHGGSIRATSRTVAIHHFDGHWVERTAVHALKTVAHRALRLTLGEHNHRRAVLALRALRR
jgi:hypothetical protein